MVIAPLGAISRKALGVKELAAARVVMRNGRSREAPVTAEVFRNARRVTVKDTGTPLHHETRPGR